MKILYSDLSVLSSCSKFNEFLIENFGLERNVFDVVDGGAVLTRLTCVETHSDH